MVRLVQATEQIGWCKRPHLVQLILAIDDAFRAMSLRLWEFLSFDYSDF